MRGAAILLVGLLAAALGGCLTDAPLKTSQWAENFRRFSYANTSNIVQVEIRLIERPVGESYINTEVWKFTDEQVVEVVHKGVLEDSGFRVGQIVGSLPARLHNWLTSERCCVNPHCLVRAAGKEMPIQLSPLLSECRFQVPRDGQPVELEFHQAQCSFVVVPAFTEDGRTRLKFTPRVEYGETTTNFRAADDRSGWVQEIRKPRQSLTELSWEVTLAPNDWLVIGCLPHKDQTFAYQSLVDRTSQTPVQRLLVLRTNRSGKAGIDAEIFQRPAGEPGASGEVQPLALQATAGTGRRGSN